MKISVIIPSYNCSTYVREAIESVLKQTYKNFEIIVVDDGSTDNTRCILDDLIHEEKIRYLLQKNAGPACARNAGLRASKGEYIAFLDADDRWMPEKLRRSIECFEKNSQLGLVHCAVRAMDEKGDNLFFIKKKKMNRKVLAGHVFYHLLFRRAHLCTSSVVIRKSCLEKTGNFDEKLSFLGAEDRDLWLRIAEIYPFEYIEEPLTYYRHRDNSISTDEEKMKKGRDYIINKYFYKLSWIGRRKAFSALHKELAYARFSQGCKCECFFQLLKAFLFYPFDIELLKITAKNCIY